MGSPSQPSDFINKTYYPEVARDTLETIDPLLLRQPNRAYYHLLYTIATDKLYQPFYSDSLISEVVDYYEKQPLSDNYLRALLYKELEKLTTQLKGKPLLSRFYYSIAKIYRRIDEPDSALYYAQKAIDNIADTSFQSKNYYLHTYLADMARQEGNYELASTHYKEAFELLLKSVDEKTRKRIYELEKKYDLSRVEVNALRARQRHQGMMVAMTVGILVLLLLLYSFKQRLRRKQLVLENQRLKLQALEEEYRYNQYAKQQSENLVAIYRLLARGQTDVRDRFERLSMKYINKNQAFYEALQAVLTFLKDEFTAQMEELANSGVLDMYKIPDTIELSATEKIILFLIYCQTTAKENATLLGISANNYGVKKWHLKQKLSPYATKSEDIKEVLSRFEAQNPPKSH